MEEVSKALDHHSEAFIYALGNYAKAFAVGSFDSAARDLNEAATHAAILTELRAMLAAGMGHE